MGMRHVSTSPTVAWSGLAAQEQSFPGMLVHWRGGANIPWQNVRGLCPRQILIKEGYDGVPATV